MKKILNAMYKFLCACGQAKYAAELARNGQHERAKDLYR